MVLVFGRGETAKAIITTIVTGVDRTTDGRRLKFMGPVVFENSTKHHINDVLLPLVDRLMDSLGLARKNFVVSAANPAAASVANLNVKVTGFSADVPLFLGLLSAGLEMPISDEIVYTGHIASGGGDISAVSELPVKLQAAVADDSVRSFVCPTLEKDHSLETLWPLEKERAIDAINTARDKLRVITVSDIVELAQAAFSDDAVIMAALKQGFFGRPCSQEPEQSPLTRILRFFTENQEEQFWQVLERLLLSGDNPAAKHFLRARTRFHIQRRAYPHGFGGKLLQLVHSLPPTTRRLKTAFPLVSMRDCIRLSQCARTGDHEDVRRLYDAAFGKNVCRGRASSAPQAGEKASKPESARADLDNVLSQIDGEFLARNVALPIDTARACYLLESVTIESHEQFYDVIAAFYLHLMRHTEGVIEPANLDANRAAALALAEKTFADKGGLEGALAEGRDAVHGGMRFILDALTEQFKKELQINQVRRVLKEALNPLDWRARVAFMAAFLERVAPVLPTDMRALPPERLARNHEVIVRTYVESIDKVKALLRTL